MGNGISIKDIVVTFDGREKILDGISLELTKGNIYGIIGPNGAGKTTLIRTCLGFVKPSEGEVDIDGENVSHIKQGELAKKLAFVPQNVRINTDFTGREIVLAGRYPYKKRFDNNDEEDIRIVEEAMNFTSCKEFADKRYQKLSGGEAQRVLVARAIAQQTDWIVLDEPVSSMDIKQQVLLMENLKKLNEEKKKSIIMILHDINLAYKYCSHILMLKNGKVYDEGETKKVLNEESLSELYGIEFKNISNNAKNACFYYPEIVK